LSLDEIKKIIEPVFQVRGVEGVVVATSDGLPLLSSLEDREKEEKVAALTAVLSEVGNRTSMELGKGEAEWITIHTPSGSGVLLLKVGEIGYMAVLFDKDTKLGVLLYTLRNVRNEFVKKFGG